jgi:uncharacterized protein RhaS with RHS repeats
VPRQGAIGNQSAFVTDAQGTQTFHYLYGLDIDSVLAQDSPTGMVWTLSDRLGTIDLLTDGSGNVVDKRTFDSFEKLLTQTNLSVQFRYGYTGREYDTETGLDYLSKFFQIDLTSTITFCPPTLTLDLLLNNALDRS